MNAPNLVLVKTKKEKITLKSLKKEIVNKDFTMVMYSFKPLIPLLRNKGRYTSTIS